MAFFMWNQNNSGGHFVVNENLTWRVVIEADTYKQAEQKAFDLGVYYNGRNDGRDCECCGDRWYEGEEWDTESKTLEEYLQDYADKYGWEDPSVIIHYADGTKGTITKAVKKMSEDGKDVLGIMVGVALIICGAILLLSPSPMQICIKAGYEWRGGDCVMGVDYD